MRTGFLLGAALVLVACSTVDAPGPGSTPPPAGVTYRGHGTEPFWNIAIGGGRIVYGTPEPGERIEVAAPAPRTTFNGRRYETPRLTVDISHGRCNDGMSDLYYADTVRVTFPGGGRALEGCGGAPLPPDRLADTAWSIAVIDGETIVAAESYRLEFGPDRLSGQAGCNRFSGTYAEAEGRLTTGPIMSTRMACPAPRMGHERKLLRLLRGPATFSYPDGGSLLLSGNGIIVRLNRQ